MITTAQQLKSHLSESPPREWERVSTRLLAELVAITDTLNEAMPHLAYDLREHMAEYKHETTPRTRASLAKLEELLAAYFARTATDGEPK